MHGAVGNHMLQNHPKLPVTESREVAVLPSVSSVVPHCVLGTGGPAGPAAEEGGGRGEICLPPHPVDQAGFPSHCWVLLTLASAK